MKAREGYMTIREVAKETGMKVRTIRDWVNNGMIKAEKNGTSYFWEIPVGEIVNLSGRKPRKLS